MLRKQHNAGAVPPEFVPCNARCRAFLLRGTALTAVSLAFLPAPGMAQLAPGARPVGGTVVGGQASISQAGTSTTIQQKTQQADINWQSFNVGSQQSVVFQQPNSSAVVLNQVVGPNPSEIAGRITANGQVIITNQSGVVFDQGSQVDTAGLVVSAAGITRQNFMAGHMVFNQAAHAGARVINNGNITIAQAGLAALVAPQVSNAGVIQARLGRVILAGAAAYTLDLYGDGLVALNVTNQVTAVNLGGHSVPALVTNIGTIVADGGSVLLTAQAADGLVRTLVTAGGTIAANTLGSQTGRVLVQGIGGSVEIEGSVSATGVAAGTRGGQVVVNATGTVGVGPAASIDASGQSGGGLIALGTTATRAAGGAHVKGQATAAATTVAAGARISADALSSGAGGRITLLSTGSTSLAGAISVLGGPGGGNGGAVEISGASIVLTGTVDAAAPHGTVGQLLLDPTNLYVSAGTITNLVSGDSDVTIATLEAMNANVSLTAANAVDFLYTASPPMGTSNLLNLGAHALTVTAGAGGVNVDSGFSIIAGTVSMTATGGIAFNTSNAIALLGPGNSTAAPASLSATALTLNGRTGVALASASLAASEAVTLETATGIIAGTGPLATPSLAATAGAGISLTGLDGATTLGTFASAAGNVTIGSTQMVTVADGVTAAGTVSLQASGLVISAPIQAATVSLVATLGNIDEIGSGAVTATTLSGSATPGGGQPGRVMLAGNNQVGTITSLSAGGDFVLQDNAALVVDGPLTAGSTLALRAPGLTVAATGQPGAATIAAGGTIDLASDKFDFAGGVATAGLVGLDLYTAGGTMSLTGHASDSFSGAGLGSVTAGTLALGSLDGITPSGNVTGIRIAAPLTASGPLGLFTTATGTVSVSGGITTGMLFGNAGFVTINGPQNAVTDLGTFTAASLTLSQAGALDITGVVDGGALAAITAGGVLTVAGSVTAQATALTSGSIAIPGDVTGSTTLALNATSGAITESGSLATALLTGSATGSATLTGSNTIAALKDFTAAGFSLDDTDGLTIQGAVDGTAQLAIADQGALTVARGGSITGNTASLSATDISILGSVTAARSLLLTATGGITEAGGIATGALSVSAGTSALLTSNSNTISQIAAGAATNDFRLSDSIAVTVTGDITAGGGATLALSGPAITLAAAAVLSAPGGVISLSADALTLHGDASTGASGVIGIDTFSSPTLTVDSLWFAHLTAGEVALGSADGRTPSPLIASILLPERIDLTGQAGTLGLFTAAGGTIAGMAGITATVLTGDAGAVTLSGNNGVTDIGNFEAGSFALSQSGALDVTGALTVGTAAAITTGGTLTVAGSVSADTVALNGAGLDIPGRVSGTTAVMLTATNGAISDTGTIITALLTGSATGSASFGGGSITDLGNFTAAGFSLMESGSLDVTGTVQGGTLAAITSGGALTISGQVTSEALSLKGASVTIPGSVTGSNTVVLTATDGAIIENGALTTAVLSGSASGSAALTGRNDVTGLGNFTADGFVLNTAPDLTVSGTVSGGAAVSINDAGTLSLASGGGITGSTSTLLAAAIDIAGSIDAAGTLSLTAMAGAIAETGAAGAISTGLLTGSATGSAQFGGPNSIADLGNFTAAGFSLADTAPLSVTGAVQSGGLASIASDGALEVAGSVTANAVSLTGASLDILGTVTGSSTMTLTATGGAITGSGPLTTALLTGSATGDASLTGNNAISGLGSFTADGFTLDTAPDLTISGAVNGGPAVAIVDAGILTLGGGGSIAGSITTLQAAALGLAGTIDAPGTLSLTGVSGPIAQSGSLTTGLLTGSATGGASFAGTDNIGDLGNFTAAAFSLQQAGPLDITGVVQAGTTASIALGGALTVDGSVAAETVSLAGAALSIPGSVTGTTALALAADGGAITGTGMLSTAMLTVSAGGSATLTGNNAIAELGQVTAAAFTLNDVPALTVTGPVTAGSVSLADDGIMTVAGSINAPVTELTAAAIAIPGSITAANALSLTALSGTVIETGTLATALMSGSSAGRTSLTGDNAIRAIGNYTASGFQADDSGALTVTGTLAGGASTALTTTGALAVDSLISGAAVTLTAASVAIGGAIQAPDILDLTATQGGITGSGQIETGTLTGTAQGAVSLSGSGNMISILAQFTSAGFSLNDSTSLAIAGPLSGGASVDVAASGGLLVTGTIAGSTTALSAATMTLTSTIDAPQVLSLNASAGAIDAPGQIVTGLLTGGATGGASLTGANEIAAVGNFTSAALTLNDAPSLTLAGTVNAGAAAAITDGGTIILNGSLLASDVTLHAAAVDAPGVLVASLLTGSTTGSSSFTGSNQLAAIGDYAASGLTLDDAAALAITGAVAAGPAARITDAVGLAVPGSLSAAATTLQAANIGITGSVDAGTFMSLAATGGSITAPGTLFTPSLTVTASGSANLTGLNRIATLQSAVTHGNFALRDDQALLIGGPVMAVSGNVAVTAAGLIDAADIGASGNIALAASTGDLVQSAGTISALGRASRISLDAPTEVALSGTLDAPTILIGSAATYQAPKMVLWENNKIETGSAIPLGSDRPDFPDADGATPGVFVYADALVQTGTTLVNPGGGAGTIDLSLAAPNGSIALNRLVTAGLIAPTSQLFLNLQSGSVSGHVNVAGLSVTYTPPIPPALSKLTGTIDGLSGQSAAGRGYILPLESANYQFNSCAIGSINCVLLSPVLVPVYDPDSDLQIETPRRRRQDDDLIIPNVSEEDF